MKRASQTVATETNMAHRDRQNYAAAAIWADYVEAWRTRLARQECERQEHARLLREVARDCARCLVLDFGASKVYLFGSLLGEGRVHDRSDIDLAVEGLETGLYFKALSSIWQLLPPGTELDLVPLESARPGLAERVVSEGVLLDVTA